jgi:hypothetical protein
VKAARAPNDEEGHYLWCAHRLHVLLGQRHRGRMIDWSGDQLHWLPSLVTTHLAGTNLSSEALNCIEELRRAGVELVTVSDGFDLTGPASEMVLCVMAWAAQMERLATCERIAAARLRVEAEGGTWGRPRRLDDAQLAKVMALRRKGRSLRQIAVAMRTPLSTIGDSLRRASE